MLGEPATTILFILVLFSGLYMAWNIGANDVANAMGTSVGSGALTLRRAVLLAAILEFSGAFFFGSWVSETIQSGIVNPMYYTDKPQLFVYGMLSALVASGLWLQIATYFGWPVSATHAIVGAIVGFGAVSSSMDAIEWDQVAYIFTSWVISPLMGGLLSYAVFHLLRRKIFYSRQPVLAAQKMAPYLVFGACSVLMLLLLFKGLENLHLHLHFIEALLISMGVAGVAALATRQMVRRIQPISPVAQVPLPYGQEIAVELDKARKHLGIVQGSSTGEMHYHVSLLIEEVESLSQSLRRPPKDQVENTEYRSVEKIFSRLQIMSACLMAFAHGANDVANAIGPLAAAMGILQSGTIQAASQVHVWLLALGGLGIVMGLATWGWRVMETIGTKITELTPSRGFAAEFSAAATIVFASRLGLPISTTHTLVGAVLGVACARGIGALNLATTRDIVISWIVTIPAGAVLSMAIYWGLVQVFG